MKSLVTLIISHITLSIFVVVLFLSGEPSKKYLILILLCLPALNKLLAHLNINSDKARLLNSSLCFFLISLPQLTNISTNWRYFLLSIVAGLSGFIYLYTFYRLLKETKRKTLI